MSRVLHELSDDFDDPDLMAALTAAPQRDTVPNASGQFRYERSNPIPVCEPDGELKYLARLRCACGEPFTFHRAGSFGPGSDDHVVDGFEL